jgi:hypothetical protein
MQAEARAVEDTLADPQDAQRDRHDDRHARDREHAGRPVLVEQIHDEAAEHDPEPHADPQQRDRPVATPAACRRRWS